MFPKKKRLTKKQFNRFFASGRRLHGQLFQLVYSQQTESTEPYVVAASVGKKVSKSAVKRNRLRRQMYHALRDAALVSGVYIVIAKPAAATATYEMTVREITALVEKANRQ